jgi:hypothetical protein
LLEADEGAAEGEEGLMDVGAAFVADSQPAKAVEPSQHPLDHPAVPSELLAALDPAPRGSGKTAGNLSRLVSV